MATENAGHDNNHVPSLIAVSSVDGTSTVKVYADPSTHRLLVDATAGVVGPVSSTDNAVARWDGVTGLTIQDSSVTIDDSGVVDALGGYKVGGVAGITTTVTTASLVGKTITITNGIITGFA